MQGYVTSTGEMAVSISGTCHSQSRASKSVCEFPVPILFPCCSDPGSHALSWYVPTQWNFSELGSMSNFLEKGPTDLTRHVLTFGRQILVRDSVANTE